MNLKIKIIGWTLLYFVAVIACFFLIHIVITFGYILTVNHLELSTWNIIKNEYFDYFINLLAVYWWQNLLASLAFVGIWFVYGLFIKKSKWFKSSKRKDGFKEDIKSLDKGFMVDEVESKDKKTLNKNFLAGRMVLSNPKNFFSSKTAKWDNGWVIKFDEKNYWVADEKTQPHALVIGATGSGKTQRVLLPNILYNSDPRLGNKQANFLIPVPKGEISSLVGEELIKRNYKIHIIDIQNPEYSKGFNPLAFVWDLFYIDEESEAKRKRSRVLAEKELKNIVESLPWTQNNKESTWVEGAKSRTLAMLKFLLYYNLVNPEFKKEHFNLMNCFQFSNYNVFASGKWLEIITKNQDNSYMKQLWNNVKGLKDDAPETLKSFLTNVSIVLDKIYNDELLRSLTSRNDFDINRILKDDTQPFCVFIKFPDNEPANFWLISLLIDRFYQLAITLADSLPEGKLKRKLLVLIDEFGNMPRIKDFDNKITISRSRNIGFLVVVQSKNQINVIYEKSSKTILENLNLTFFLSSASQETLEWMAKTIGNKEVVKTSYSTNSNKNGGGSSENSSISSEKIMEVDHLAKLPIDQAIIKPMQLAPLRIKTKMSYEIFKDIMGNKKFDDVIYEFNEEAHTWNFDEDKIESSEIEFVQKEDSDDDLAEESWDPEPVHKKTTSKKGNAIKAAKKLNSLQSCLIDPNHSAKLAFDKLTGKEYWRCEMNSSEYNHSCDWDSRQTQEERMSNGQGQF